MVLAHGISRGNSSGYQLMVVAHEDDEEDKEDDDDDDDDVEDDDDDDDDDDLLEHLCVELSVGARPHIVLVKCLNLVVIIKYRSIILDSITHVDVSKFQFQYISCVL